MKVKRFSSLLFIILYLFFVLSCAPAALINRDQTPVLNPTLDQLGEKGKGSEKYDN